MNKIIEKPHFKVAVKEIMDKNDNVSPVYLMIKRVGDIIVASVAFILLSPIMLLIGISIKVVSPGPLLFRQKRIGYRGDYFDILKFRTMRVDAEKVVESLPEYHNREEPFAKIKGDSRVFALGKILRKTSLDELPQLFNILFGQMSFVGPRPFLAEEIALCNNEQLKRLLVKPGLTGWAQINGRTDVSFDELMNMDLYYYKNRSLLLDIKIVLKTIVVVLSHKGAY